MTKPTIKSSSSSLNQFPRPKPAFLIHKKSHPQLYKVSHKSNSSPYLILTLARKNAQTHPEVLSLFKNSNKNAPSLDDLAEEASTKLDQVSNKLKSVLNDLDNVNISSSETSLNSEQEVADVFTDLSESLFKNCATKTLELALQSLSNDSSELEALELALQSLGEDSPEQTIPGQDAINNSVITE